MPTDNPFYDGAGPNVDSIWASGLRNPYPRLLRRADRQALRRRRGRQRLLDRVGGGRPRRRRGELRLAELRGRHCGNPRYTARSTRIRTSAATRAITGGFVYHGTQFPSAYQGSYFFADYTQNWIKRLTFDANGNVNGVFNFEPPDGRVDGPYGDIVYLTEGPDGALYYVDLGYSDVGGTFGVSKIRRIRYRPVEPAADRGRLGATRPRGPRRSTVNFSSAGSSDPEGQPLTYSWTFGDGATSTAANPSHTYTQAGQYTARLSRLRRHRTRRSRHRSRSASALRRRRRSSRPHDGAIVPRRRRDLVQRRRDGRRGRHAAGQRLHLEHRLPARGPRAPGHPDDRREERDVHDPDDRPRLQRQHALPDHAHRDRLGRPDRRPRR